MNLPTDPRTSPAHPHEPHEPAPPHERPTDPARTPVSEHGSAPPTQPPPPSHVAGVRNVIVAAVVAAVVAAGIAFPVARATVGAERGADGGAVSSQPVSDAGDGTATSIADVASAVSPSVGFVRVGGPSGQGSGSAVIVDAEGYLLTNAHVVDGAAQIEVTLPDGNRYDADLVGSDPTSDIAVLQVDASGLPAVEIAQDVEVGQTVVAIGSPFGLEGSVTSGIVSGTDRTLQGGQGQGALLGMIQTDAAINPGNSGGALVDTRGRLVGINTAIFSASGTSSGVGFAIPAATAMATAEQLIDTGVVTYAQLGISGGDVSPALASAYGLAVDEGALVVEVLPGTGAAEAGLAPGDVVVAFDGEPVTSMNQLSALVRSRTPGETVTLEVDRDGEEVTLPVVLGDSTG